MRRKVMAVFCILACIIAYMPHQTSAQTVNSFTIAMVGYPPDENITVGGLFHNVNISLNAPSDSVRIMANYTGARPETNITNTYSWSYDAGSWADDIYSYYINGSECSRIDDTFCFTIAIDSIAESGYWRWKVFVGGSEEYNHTFILETPTAGIRMVAPTFYFRVIPYGSGFISSYIADDPTNSSYLTTENIGNTPLDVSITYDEHNYLFTTSNTTGVWSPGERRTHYIDFQASSWSPRKFSVNGIIHGVPRLLATPLTVSCTITPQTSYDVVVLVARQGYSIFQMGDVVVQYKNLYPGRSGDDLTMDLFLTSKEDPESIYLSGEGDNITINSVTYLGEEQNSPFLLSVQEEPEAHVQVNITCSTPPPPGQPSMLAYATFKVESDDRIESDTFNITVLVSPVSGGDEDSGLGPPSLIAIGFIIVALVLLGAFTLRTRRKAEVEKRRELEERIRRKKEKALKKRKKV